MLGRLINLNKRFPLAGMWTSAETERVGRGTREISALSSHLCSETKTSVRNSCSRQYSSSPPGEGMHLSRLHLSKGDNKPKTSLKVKSEHGEAIDPE